MLDDYPITENWQCPHCGQSQPFHILDTRVCERCGWSDEKPADDQNIGYE